MRTRQVSMHLLVLSAFRLEWSDPRSYSVVRLNAPFGAQCFPTRASESCRRPEFRRSQCTFWCSVLSDVVIIHVPAARDPRLNAPFGAQCFPTRRLDGCQGKGIRRLNAPFGAQCFPTGYHVDARHVQRPVSMHLLVLSAFRLEDREGSGSCCYTVSMHLLVLSAFRRLCCRAPTPLARSQCTFWCSVLSDVA